MATATTKKRVIKYLNKDFNSFKSDLIEYLKVYFPNTYADFNESAVGMLLTELSAFIGDNLSYYLDRKFDESFVESAKERKNVFRHAKQLGFKAFGKTASVGTVDAYLKVPAIEVGGLNIPDMRFAGTIKKGAKCKSKVGETYETLVDIDFSKVNINDSKYVQIADTDPTSNQPSTFVLKVADVDIKAGETKTTTFSVGTYKSFLKLTIPEDDVLEIIKITDAEANQWYETDYLCQDTVFDSTTNTGTDSGDVPYILKLRSVPFRFITEYDIDANRMSMIFGTGDAQTFDGDLIPDLGDLSLPLYGKDTFTDFNIDPQNFLRTQTMGLAPVNTTLIVQYRVGGGSLTSAGTGDINSVADSVFDIGDSTLDINTVKDVGNSFTVLNSHACQGGKDELSLDEIKALISAFYASQNRMITIEDFIVRSLSMPAKFGSVFRCGARINPLNSMSVELSILSKDSNGYVTIAPENLKNNLKTYLNRFRMLTDSIEILDGQIVNLAVDFSILVNPDSIKSEVLSNCILALQEFFDTDIWQIGQPINNSTIHNLLMSIPGVLSVININFTNRVGVYDGRQYSNTTYNIKQNTQNNIIYINNNIFPEIKFKGKDITGVAR